jgi:hypothetical protein
MRSFLRGEHRSPAFATEMTLAAGAGLGSARPTGDEIEPQDVP